MGLLGGVVGEAERTPGAVGIRPLGGKRVLPLVPVSAPRQEDQEGLWPGLPGPSLNKSSPVTGEAEGTETRASVSRLDGMPSSHERSPQLRLSNWQTCDSAHMNLGFLGPGSGWLVSRVLEGL